MPEVVHRRGSRRRPPGDSELVERAFSEEGKCLDHSDGGSVAGHDESMDTVEASDVEGPTQDLAGRGAHEATAPEPRMEVIGQLSMRVGQ